MTEKTCRTCGVLKPFDQFTLKSSSADGHAPYCRDCSKLRRQQRRATRPARSASVAIVPQSAGPTTTAVDDFIVPRDVTATWAAVQMIAKDGDLAPNMLFIGPSGSGKTECAKQLARLSGLPFFQVDAPAMTDPEAWFGTREVVVKDGAPMTVFSESVFVQALQQPCVLLIDEGNRAPDRIRNILLGVFDDSRAVTNPLTGQRIERHPLCFVVMTGNVGLAFTGTYAVDVAFTTRMLTSHFDYLPVDAETKLAVRRTGASQEHASMFVRFANESRAVARTDPDFPPISTREVLTACKLTARGLDVTIAARQAMISAASDEGGALSIRAKLEMIWTGIVPADPA